MSTHCSSSERMGKRGHRHARIMFAGLLGAGFVCALPPQGLAQNIELSSINGSNGVRLDGTSPDQNVGAQVSNAGDINGDGFDDVIVGAPLDQVVQYEHRGAAYVLFGSGAGFPASLKASSLNGTNGFRAIGSESMQAGRSVAAAGDVNNDGFDDVIIGAPGSGAARNGAAFVVFGKAGGFPAEIALDALNGSDGFKLTGVTDFDAAGSSVSGNADVNNDGIADIVIGAPRADLNGTDSGAAYVVFGKASFPAVTGLETLDGSNGFVLKGESSSDYAGMGITFAGDANGDGIDDILVGAPYASPTGFLSGASYLAFGSGTPFPAAVELSALTFANGLKIYGTAERDYSGRNVASVGDVNSDGYSDVIIGALHASPSLTGQGSGFVVFGSAPTTNTLNLSSLDGSNGFRINGAAEFDFVGLGVGGAGDINRDGFDDVIVGAVGANAPGNNTGSSYLLFGKSSFTSSSVINLAGLDESVGFRIDGATEGDEAGNSVSGAGDFNGDGFTDLLIGAQAAGPKEEGNPGSAYVVFGPTPFTVSKMKIALNFGKPSSDSISLAGTIRVPGGFSMNGQQVGLDIGGVATTFTLDSKGIAKSGGESFRLKVKAAAGGVVAQDAPFTASFKKGNFAIQLSDDGLVDDNVAGVQVEIPVTVNAAGKQTEKIIYQTYTAKQGSSGKTK